MFRLAALGTVVWDTIHTPPTGDGRQSVHEDWGGLFYSLAALGAASASGRVVVPIVKIGADLYDSALERLEELPGRIDTSGLRRVPEPNNRVELRYHDRRDRCENLRGAVPGWTWDELAPLVVSCDALYVNFIAGWELDLAAAEALRAGFEGPIYTDIHSLLLGVEAGGRRVRRALPEWRRWVACFDWVQGNAEELGVMTGRDDALAAARAIAAEGPAAVFATEGRKGAAWSSASGREGRAEPQRERAVEPGGVSAVVDPTGCGDVWGGACVSALLEGAGPAAAAEVANRFGATAARHLGTRGLAERLETVSWLPATGARRTAVEGAGP